ncbi:MAG: hypothetical protein IJ470_03675 [Clostridia bacterium]|nr:hypothetical protein [Clostridia bacterium]
MGNENVIMESTISTELQEESAAEEQAEEAFSPQEESNAETDAASEEPNTEAVPEGTESEQAQSSDEEITLRVNHEDITLSVDEAKNYAQQGLKYSKDIYPKLDYLATISDMSIGDFINSLIAQSEEAYKKSLVDKYGDDEEVIGALLDKYHAQSKDKYEKAVAAREKETREAAENQRISTETRIANEFIALQKEFPDIKEFSELPAPVKKAVAEGERLMTAYLYHLHAVNKVASAVKATEAEAAKASAGSLSTGESEDGLTTAFLDGLWRK